MESRSTHDVAFWRKDDKDGSLVRGDVLRLEHCELQPLDDRSGEQLMVPARSKGPLENELLE